MPSGDRRGAHGRRDGPCRDPALRPARVPAHRDLGRQVPGGTLGLAEPIEVVGPRTVSSGRFWVSRAAAPIVDGFEWFTSLRIDLPRSVRATPGSPRTLASSTCSGSSSSALIALYAAYETISSSSTTLDWHDLLVTMGLTLLTMLRVVVLLVLATLVWVPVARLDRAAPGDRRAGAAAGAVPRGLSGQRRFPDRRRSASSSST